MSTRAAMTVLLAGALLGATAAEAATPTRGATYTGFTRQGSTYDVRLVVARTTARRVRTVRFEWRAPTCGRARNGTQGVITARNVRVRRGGYFTARGTNRETIPPSPQFAGGSQNERYVFSGRFRSAGTATGFLRVDVSVLNRAGQLVDTCKTPNRVRWTARRLGTIDEEPGYSLPG